MLEHIMGYFGTYTPAADGAIATFQFEYLTTLGFAAIVIFLGRAIVAHSALLRKYAIPAPVISGIIFSVVVSIIKGSGIIGFSFDAKIVKDLCQNLFFLCVGFGFSYKMLKHAGGKLCIAIAVAACVLITLQDVVGYLVGSAIGLHPLLALQCSSSAMSGGVGTASAFGPIFENMGAPDATTVGVAAGTMGNIMGSLIGGPVAAFLISRHGLKSDPNDRPESSKSGSAAVLNNTRMIKAFALSLLVAALGMPIYCLLDNIPMIEMPKFIGCLFAGAIARNIMDAAGIFAIFVSFNLFGRDYGAAVMAAGNCGWGCGSGPNAVANEKAVMDQYGWHTVAWVLYPSFAVIIDDIYNPIFLSIFSSLITK